MSEEMADSTAEAQPEHTVTDAAGTVWTLLPWIVEVADDRGTVHGWMLARDTTAGRILCGTVIPPEGHSADCWLGELAGDRLLDAAVVDDAGDQTGEDLADWLYETCRH